MSTGRKFVTLFRVGPGSEETMKQRTHPDNSAVRESANILNLPSTLEHLFTPSLIKGEGSKAGL